MVLTQSQACGLVGMASSLGQAVTALPLLHLRHASPGKPAERQQPFVDAGTDGRCKQGSSCYEGSNSSRCNAGEVEASNRPSRSKPEQDDLGLLRLDLEQQPGYMPHFSSVLSVRLEPLRELFATKSVVEAYPSHACEDLTSPEGGSHPENEDYYRDRMVVVSRGSCLFVQKLLKVQAAGAAGVIVVNSEVNDMRLQVMTCPSQDRGGGSEVRIPAAMISWTDGQELLQRIRAQKPGVQLTSQTFSSH
eukprot:TRINITY_DN9161_c0_g1_i1.p1 TRINITY_DN9161_c0_g1~~TRINITY_DN9161_c0_g1_i1.p1  ORF type:complete len:248 (-),score=54.50 TRINITY_DN9161_c0_g1_i1:95-838(-)